MNCAKEDFDKLVEEQEAGTLEGKVSRLVDDILEGGECDEVEAEGQLDCMSWAIECASDFEKIPYGIYSGVTKWCASERMLYMWGFRHEHGTEEQRKWIEDWLDDINFHTACGYLEKGDYKGFYEWVSKED